MSDLIALVGRYAANKRIELPPQTLDEPEDSSRYDSLGGLDRLAATAGWERPLPVSRRPKPDDFPLFCFDPQSGWLLADQWENTDDIRMISPGGERVIGYSGELAFFDLLLPDPVRRMEQPKAFSIFWSALMKRKRVLVTAALATTVANIVTLATSLYSMQVYDRVIPRGSYSTLWVLTIGVGVALLIDFALRATRALMVERESADIDAEISEFFFARAQSIRLDARPQGVGTMAANLRGLEQVRAALSSSSLFLVADLPFALFFIFVIFALGGPIAFVPLVSFPISLLLAWMFARMVRADTDKAQVSGNQKNGLLVESIDAAETVKANRGGWHMLGRWNRLVETVHHHEDPIKRWTSIASSMFSTLQQVTYVALIAFGAMQVAVGNMTMGALIAAAIIAGRVNGPLVSQLPSMIVQWGYARSSLRLLDNILTLPLDDAPDTASLRPETLGGPLQCQDIDFSYPGARETVVIPQLTIPEGQRVGVIGGIGSGKSTLLRLLAGLYRPANGRITIGGLDVSLIADDILRRHIGYLAQDLRLVNGTLRDNLLLGLSNPGDEQVMEAARRTGLAQLIGSNPRGLDLPIAEGGRGLSGGQRAVAGLTRLLLAQPKIWLLDEPTANLDQGTESTILKLLAERVSDGGTMVIVTHRLQLLSLVDRVIVMNGGKIAVDGPTQQVLAHLRGQADAARPRPVEAVGKTVGS